MFWTLQPGLCALRIVKKYDSLYIFWFDYDVEIKLALLASFITIYSALFLEPVYVHIYNNFNKTQ